MKRSVHPHTELFEYAAGRLDPQSIPAIEEHLARCSDCNLLAQSMRSLKSAMGQEEYNSSHPTVGELADFFYASSRARYPAVAAHIGHCASCADEIAQYARAESAASNHKSAMSSASAVPAAAWEMIQDWEDSSFAKPKDESLVANGELLSMLSALLNREGESREIEEQKHAGPNLEAVTIINSAGQIRTVELFQRVTGALKHSAQSDRYDDKPVHVVLDLDSGTRVVVSDKVKGDRIELKRDQSVGLVRAHYFIVED